MCYIICDIIQYKKCSLKWSDKCENCWGTVNGQHSHFCCYALEWRIPTVKINPQRKNIIVLKSSLSTLGLLGWVLEEEILFHSTLFRYSVYLT